MEKKTLVTTDLEKHQKIGQGMQHLDSAVMGIESLILKINCESRSGVDTEEQPLKESSLASTLNDTPERLHRLAAILENARKELISLLFEGQLEHN